jgi:uncharacterized protein YjbJ (UPF0337 family)
MTDREMNELDQRDPDQKVSDWAQRMQDEGAWQQFKGSIREHWGDLTDDEMDQSRGSLEQLIGAIKEKTGETTDSIRDAIQKMAA